MPEKRELRARLRAVRRRMDAEALKTDSAAVCERILASDVWKTARTVLAYIAVRGELDLSPLTAQAGNRRILLPRCEEMRHMTARSVENSAQLIPGAFGIPEPSADCAVIPPQDIDLILVPGVAFDRSLHRLGQGGGYYDRYLPETGAYRLGVCHRAALLNALPYEAHDCRMDAVVTPDEWITGEGKP